MLLLLPLAQFEAALLGALSYDKCRAAPDAPARARCQLDKALVNLGADLASIVSGRVSTELDARLARNTEALIAKAEHLTSLYAEMGVSKERLLFRVPATWEAVQAVRALEARGIGCHVHDVYNLAQAAAAAEAAASVIQPSVTTLGDWATKHPNALSPGQRAPRPDAGALFTPGAEPRAAALGRDLAAACLAYLRARQLPGKLMAVARSAADVRALAGADYLVTPLTVLSELAAAGTTAGYNDGISGGGGSAEEAERSPLQARADEAAAAVAAAFPKVRLVTGRCAERTRAHARSRLCARMDARGVRVLLCVRLLLIWFLILTLLFASFQGGVFSGDRADFDAAMSAGPAAELLEAALQARAHTRRLRACSSSLLHLACADAMLSSVCCSARLRARNARRRTS
jgi:hypothetical protein